MNLNSKYFDLIRIAPRKARERAKAQEPEKRGCEWPGCTAEARHRAPKGRGIENTFQWFCLDHVREFNQSYNFFDGMSDDDVAAYRESTVTGHRPTWKIGANPWAHTEHGRGFRGQSVFDDPFGFFRGQSDPSEGAKDDMPRRPPRNAERRALEVLGLDATVSLNEIKSRYKELVKKHHPDANGGDKSAEERLRNVIQAYDYLKKSGFC